MTHPTITLTREGRAELRFPYDALFIEQLKAAVPAYARRYDPLVKAWTVTPAYVAIAFRLMHLAFADVEIEDLGESGRRSSDRAPHAGDPHVVLHLLPSAPPELVTAAHKCLAKLNHPLTAGSRSSTSVRPLSPRPGRVSSACSDVRDRTKSDQKAGTVCTLDCASINALGDIHPSWRPPPKCHHAGNEPPSNRQQSANRAPTERQQSADGSEAKPKQPGTDG